MKFFCKDNVKPIFALAGFDAGYLFAKNNPNLKAEALGVVEGILTALKGGSTTEAVNAMLKEAAMEWVATLKDPLIEANVMFILTMVQLDLNVPAIPNFSAPEIEAILGGFKNGAAAVK